MQETDEVDVSRHRMAIRTSTAVEGAERVPRLNRSRVPSRTPAGIVRLTCRRLTAVPVPSHVAQRSIQTSPRPPHSPQVVDSGTESGTWAP
jgi:hypothetical protein